VNRELAEKIANTVLYEGYMLYPYRPSSLKNQQRWNFGTLYPPQYEEVRRGTERRSMHVECLLASVQQEKPFEPAISIRVRFLQLSSTSGNDWGETLERSVEVQFNSPSTERFEFPEISGSLHFAAEAVNNDVLKLSIDLTNETSLEPPADRNHALLRSLVSAHIIVYAERGEFVSLLDPPDALREAVTTCRNIGCFPVLIGAEGERDMLLCSPIILYDYPQIAPESAGNFFDSTEMDEMLTLRVLTLTPEEKQAVRDSDERARALLERTEQDARQQLAKIHGTVRCLRPIDEP
jgi:hypothetical protein